MKPKCFIYVITFLIQGYIAGKNYLSDRKKIFVIFFYFFNQITAFFGMGLKLELAFLFLTSFRSLKRILTLTKVQLKTTDTLGQCTT